MTVYDAAKPALFRLPPETAHRTVHELLAAVQDTRLEGVVADHYTVVDSRLRVDAFGQAFRNPVGVAAGFDKNAEIPNALAALGFGFNNDGADVVGERLAGADARVPVGVNLGKSKSTPNDEAEEDYLYTFERVRAGGDYFVVNVSSPNTPGLRELQERDRLESILGTLQDVGADPLLVKLSPDLPDAAVEDALEVVDDLGLDGVIATNTTTDRSDSLYGAAADESGGLSGAPIETEATDMVRFVAERTDAPIVGVGGVSDAEGAYRKIRNGASVVQLYTGLVFEGPGVARDINRGLLKLLERDGFDSVTEAIGADL
ncbi:dihydroorotate dehydrogenase (quinone) [Halobacteriales archaeon QS_8_69_73]|nr:MAG: dihydroorotate dehydrogenase (quinone) [Halobacteriales archaeon QS_8_69_73]